LGTTLLDQGIRLMLVGMGTVFVFLTLLVLAMLLLSGIAARIAPASTASVSEEEVAAISAAISHHAKVH
jgi:oxaloacetate decarboxylase gamma subunit